MIFHFFLRIHDCFFITSNNILLSISIYVELIYSSIINWQNLSILLSNTHYLKIQFELVFYMGAYGLIFVLSMCVCVVAFIFSGIDISQLVALMSFFSVNNTRNCSVGVNILFFSHRVFNNYLIQIFYFNFQNTNKQVNK